MGPACKVIWQQHKWLWNHIWDDGNLWALPIVLHIDKDKSENINIGDTIILRDETFFPIASMIVKEKFKPDLKKECMQVYGTLDDNHPSVSRTLSQDGYYVFGPLKKINNVQHYDFLKYRLSPDQVKNIIETMQWKKIVGFQTRNPMHRSHVEVTKLALEMAEENSKLLLHPVVGDTQECDIDYFIRCKCYEKVINYYPEDTILLSLLPYSMRMAGPREALQHAIIRRNYGCTHFIVGRDHAGPSYRKKDGSSFYGPYDAQNFIMKYENELKMKILTVPNVQYIEGHGYIREDKIPDDLKGEIQNLSGTNLRKMIRENLPIPEWYTYPDISNELRKYNQTGSGTCIYFIGLSGSGKSTLANSLKNRLMELVCKPITILDGDIVRQNLSKGLGFSKQDRSTNVRRIGYVASEIVKHGGIVLCANIAPYEEDRRHNRELISKYGKYVEIFVDTPIDVCESRDVKGLYKSARQGKVQSMTGLDDPFERPGNSDMVISSGSILDNINKIIENYL